MLGENCLESYNMVSKFITIFRIQYFMHHIIF